MQSLRLSVLACLVAAEAKSKCQPACEGAQVCVTQADGFWSQCVDCSKASFFDQCGYWSAEFLTAAETKCGLSCADKPNTTSHCVTDKKPGCPSGRVCVTQEDGYWSQCVDCGKRAFQSECSTWGKELRKAAEEVCGASCKAELELSKGRCKPKCAEAETCVTQEDGYYSQCVDCEQFFEQCPYWEGQFLEAAEKACKLDCSAKPNTTTAAPAPCITDDKPGCPTHRTCVTQEDGYYSQCVDCRSRTFHKECVYWGAELLKAAEAACELRCADTFTV
jgi:hypothetical protein